MSLRRLAIDNEYGHPNSLAQALHRPYPKAERLIATAIGLKPRAIWPSRYEANGKPLRDRKGNGQGRYVSSREYSARHRAGNVQVARGKPA